MFAIEDFLSVGGTAYLVGPALLPLLLGLVRAALVMGVLHANRSADDLEIVSTWDRLEVRRHRSADSSGVMLGKTPVFGEELEGTVVSEGTSARQSDLELSGAPSTTADGSHKRAI